VTTPYRTPHPPGKPSERSERWAFAFMAVLAIGLPASTMAYRAGQAEARAVIPALMQAYAAQPHHCPGQGVTVRLYPDGAAMQCTGPAYRLDVEYEPRQDDSDPARLLGPWIAERQLDAPRSRWEIHRHLERSAPSGPANMHPTITQEGYRGNTDNTTTRPASGCEARLLDR
jgi:hypothetical protein